MQRLVGLFGESRYVTVSLMFEAFQRDLDLAEVAPFKIRDMFNADSTIASAVG
jgi:hypothetical protein